MAKHLSHTLEHVALISLRDALTTLAQTLRRLLAEAAPGTATLTVELLQAVSESNPLHTQTLQAFAATWGKPPPPRRRPPPAVAEREVMARAGRSPRKTPAPDDGRPQGGAERTRRNRRTREPHPKKQRSRGNPPTEARKKRK